MKTYQLIETIYKEYFIEAESLDDAINKIDSGEAKPSEVWSDERIEVADEHDGKDWKVEPCLR